MKRVTFDVIRPSDVHYILSDDCESKEKIWYSENELSEFKYQADIISNSLRGCDQMVSCNQCKPSKLLLSTDRKDPKNCGGVSPPITRFLNKMIQSELLRAERVKHSRLYESFSRPSPDDYFRRGLEQRICLERQLRKALAIKAILKYHKAHKMDSLELSLEAERRTRWASSVALQAGIQDCKDAANEYLNFFRSRSGYDQMSFSSVKSTPLEAPKIHLMRFSSVKSAPLEDAKIRRMCFSSVKSAPLEAPKIRRACEAPSALAA